LELSQSQFETLHLSITGIYRHNTTSSQAKMKLNSKNNADAELYKALVDEENQNPLKTPLVGTTKTSRSSSRGTSRCCKCILITMGLFFVIGVIFAVALYVALGGAVKALTETDAQEKFPIVQMTDRELEDVKDRVELFAHELMSNIPVSKPLVVTQDEINGFIGHSDFLRGNMFVTLKDGRVEEEYSLPTEFLPGGKGRFFVGNDHLQIDGDTIEIEMETVATHHDWFDGPLLFGQLQYLVNDTTDMFELYLSKGSIFGYTAPDDFIEERQNLMEYLNPELEDVHEILEGIESVTIEDGKITVYPKKH